MFQKVASRQNKTKGIALFRLADRDNPVLLKGLRTLLNSDNKKKEGAAKGAKEGFN